MPVRGGRWEGSFQREALTELAGDGTATFRCPGGPPWCSSKAGSLSPAAPASPGNLLAPLVSLEAPRKISFSRTACCWPALSLPQQVEPSAPAAALRCVPPTPHLKPLSLGPEVGGGTRGHPEPDLEGKVLDPGWHPAWCVEPFR
ncbi:hypothetical protein E2320_006377 [Naja naja]|nr:hypothetical protein E2320_006377 [Naja naja]